MRKFFYLILILNSCTKDNPVNQVFNEGKNSLNQGLIGVNYKGVYVNKINDIQLYDSNGNFKKIIYTYNRNYFQTMDVKDSMIFLSGNSNHTMFHCESSPSILSPQLYSVIDFYSYKNKLFVISPYENYSNISSEKTIMPNYSLRAFDVIMQDGSLFQNKELFQVSDYAFPFAAKGFTVLNDSLLVFLNQSFEMINLNQLNTRSRTLATFNNNNLLLYKMFSNNNQMYLANGNYIYSYKLVNNSLIFNSVIK